MSDLSLGEMISRHVAKTMDAAFIEKEVETRLNKLVIESIDRCLRTYSTVGKQIEEAVEAALKVDRLDLPSYGVTVTAMLKAQIEAVVAETIAGRLKQDMTKLLELAPKEVKLSEIATAMREQHEGEYGEVITVIVEWTEYGNAWVYLDEDNHYAAQQKHRCKYQFLVGKYNGIISHLTVNERDIKTTSMLGRAYGLDQKLRAYLACGTKLILDEDDVSERIGE